MNVPARLGLPNLGFGVGLRHPHFPDILKDGPRVDWFEIISENYMDHFGYGRYVVDRVREQVPLVMHGVSLSIGSAEPLDFNYLNKLKNLADQLQPAWISDHLCWTGFATANSHDLLPLPLTEVTLAHVIGRVLQVQDVLERPLVLENPSSYLQFCDSTLDEAHFLKALAEASGCGLLLDVNNVYVAAHNHGFDPVTYIETLPINHIVQIHLAGPTQRGSMLIDTHDQPVLDEVWQLYKLAMARTGGVATLLEWDANIPAYKDLLAELAKAKRVLNGERVHSEIVNTHTAPQPIDHQVSPIFRTADQGATS